MDRAMLFGHSEEACVFCGRKFCDLLFVGSKYVCGRCFGQIEIMEDTEEKLTISELEGVVVDE